MPRSRVVTTVLVGAIKSSATRMSADHRVVGEDDAGAGAELTADPVRTLRQRASRDGRFAED
jgi:hypothetical protein